MAAISEQIEALPGYDFVVDQWNSYAGQHINTKDPFYIELANGKRKRRKVPESLTSTEKKAWKRVVHSAWFHDRCFLDIWHLDLSLGMCPIVCLIPVIGPAWMWTLHGRILKFSEPLDLPAKLQSQLVANILFDLVISLVPVLGSLFAWMNACSTRNAALIDSYLRKRAAEHTSVSGGFELVNDPQLSSASHVHAASQMAVSGSTGPQNTQQAPYSAQSRGQQQNMHQNTNQQMIQNHARGYAPHGNASHGNAPSGTRGLAAPSAGQQYTGPSQNAPNSLQGQSRGQNQGQNQGYIPYNGSNRGPAVPGPVATPPRKKNQQQRSGANSRFTGAGPQESGYL